MFRLLWLVIASLTLAAPSSLAEIFKCKSKDGLTLYQNFSCDIDSLGSLPSSQAATGKPAPAVKSIQADARDSGPATSPPSVEARRSAVQPGSPPSGEPRVGMTGEEVRTIWGEPVEILQDEPRSGRVEIWQYADGRVVHINNKRRVISVER
jgi:hypothetical protein